MIPYGGIAIIVFWIAAIKMWVQHGPRIPLIFIGLFFLIYLGLPLLPLTQVTFQIFVCLLGIAMLLIDRAKSNRWGW